MTSIYNDHNVYVVGAGFSAARGLPLIADFMFALRDAHEWLIGQHRNDEAESVQKVLQFRLQSTPTAYRVQIDLENIEELFSLAAAVDDSLTKDICIAIAATLDYRAAITTSPRTRFNVEQGGPVLPASLKHTVLLPGTAPDSAQFEAPAYEFMLAGLLGYLDVRKPQATNALISFNYDVLIEEALTALEIPFSYGFTPKSVAEDQSSRNLSLSRQPRTQLLKLHGSTNWAYPGRRGGRLTIFGSYEPIRTARHAPQLVPPTWRKSFDGPLIHVWQQALKQISTATRLVIIGFSMPTTDLHFKYLVAAGLRENISLREVVFVNTDTQAIEHRANQLFGDPRRRPNIRIVHTNARNFVGQGDSASTSSSIGRSIHKAIQRVYHQ